MLGVPLFLAFAIVVAAIAAYFDWRTGHIPDRVTLVPLAIAPLAHFALQFMHSASLHQGIDAAGSSVLGAILCALVPIMVWRMNANAMGGGDIKLLAALGAILRPLAGVEAVLYAFIAAAVFACGRLAYQGKLSRMIGNTLVLALNPILPKHRRREISPEMLTPMRFGPAIFVGTCCAALTNWRPQ